LTRLTFISLSALEEGEKRSHSCRQMYIYLNLALDHDTDNDIITIIKYAVSHKRLHITL
jgi:hypothetical protein